MAPANPSLGWAAYLAVNRGNHIRVEVPVRPWSPLPLGITLNLVYVRHRNLRYTVEVYSTSTQYK